MKRQQRAPTRHVTDSAKIIAAWRKRREAPDSPEKVEQRAVVAGQIRALVAEEWPEHEPETGECMGARALLLNFDSTKSDHIAVAIGAHKLLASQVVQDITAVGETEPAFAAGLNLLCRYLEGEGWCCETGEWYDSNGPEYIRELLGKN